MAHSEADALAPSCELRNAWWEHGGGGNANGALGRLISARVTHTTTHEPALLGLDAPGVAMVHYARVLDVPFPVHAPRDHTSAMRIWLRHAHVVVSSYKYFN